MRRFAAPVGGDESMGVILRLSLHLRAVGSIE
jgi:hypothetical protein